MAKVRSYMLQWDPSPDADVTGYRVYWATPPELVTYDSHNVDVGTSTSVSVPTGGMPTSFDGYMTFGVSALDDVGNESDISTATLPFDLLAPSAPTNIRLG